MSVLDCPDPGLLVSFCDGLIDEEDSSRIGEHIDECTWCQSSLTTLLEQSRDGLLKTLRHKDGPSDSFGSEPMCRKVVERVARLSATGEAIDVESRHDMLDRAPEFIGRYKVLQLLGHGGMGSVYQALHLDLGKIVAIKLLTERLARNETAVSRFYREMKAVGNLHHPNIVAAYDAGQVHGTHYLVMEYVAGIDLSEMMNCNSLPGTPDACELVRQAAVGLDYASRQGLVHRDIKPSNLMLMLDNEGKALVKVLDLGLALLADPSLSASAQDQTTGLTGLGQVMGTVDYMAPEQALDSHKVDVRADVYSLGATLYKLLTGEVPFAHLSETSAARKLAALAYESVPSISLRRPDLPTDLARLIDSMLAKDRDQRPTTSGEVARRLAPFAVGCQLERILTKTQSATASGGCEPIVSSKSETLADQVAPATEISPSSVKAADPSVSAHPPRNKVKAALRSRSVRLFLSSALIGVFLFVAWKLGQTYYLETSHGIVVLEIKDPNLKVVLGEKSFTLENSGERYEISAGPHTLKIDHDGQTYETDKFNLLSGKTEIFHVKLIPGKVLVLQGDKELEAKPMESKEQKDPSQLSSLNPREIHTSPDWEWTIPERLGPEINTDGYECFPRLSADGLRIWFIRGFYNTTDQAWISERETLDKPWKLAKSVGHPLDLTGSMADFFMSRDEQTWMFVTWDDRVLPQIMESTRTSREGNWSVPKSVDACGIPAQFPVLTDDGLTLYLMKNYLNDDGDQICVMTRPTTTAPWSEPVRLGFPVNTRADERPVWVSSDHLVLIFHAARGDRTSSRQFDLWLTSRPSVKDAWLEPVSFGPVINTETREASASLSADGRELIFESERQGTLGASDLYISRRVPRNP